MALRRPILATPRIQDGNSRATSRDESAVGVRAGSINGAEASERKGAGVPIAPLSIHRRVRGDRHPADGHEGTSPKRMSGMVPNVLPGFFDDAGIIGKESKTLVIITRAPPKTVGLGAFSHATPFAQRRGNITKSLKPPSLRPLPTLDSRAQGGRLVLIETAALFSEHASKVVSVDFVTYEDIPWVITVFTMSGQPMVAPQLGFDVASDDALEEWPRNLLQVMSHTASVPQLEWGDESPPDSSRSKDDRFDGVDRQSPGRLASRDHGSLSSLESLANFGLGIPPIIYAPGPVHNGEGMGREPGVQEGKAVEKKGGRGAGGVTISRNSIRAVPNG